jgi:hypothetical protein
MGCYTIPTAAAIVHFFMRKKKPSLKMSKHHLWLNQLFLGGAIFGVVDHWWNGELLAFSLKDMILGVVITAVIFAVWGYLVMFDKMSSKHAAKA